MKKSVKFMAIGVVLIAGITMAFSLKTKTNKKTTKQITYTESIENTGKQLITTKCNICHEIKDSASAMLAPPFVNIKSKYKAVFKTEDAFVKGMIEFTMNPSKEKALMRGSLNKFAVMPKLGYSEANLKIIAKYIYTTDCKKPKWFK